VSSRNCSLLADWRASSEFGAASLRPSVLRGSQVSDDIPEREPVEKPPGQKTVEKTPAQKTVEQAPAQKTVEKPPAQKEVEYAPQRSLSRVDAKVPFLNSVEEHEHWAKMVSKYVKTYGGRLDEKDLTFRVETSVRIKDLATLLAGEEYDSLAELLVAIEDFVTPAKQNKMFQDFIKFTEFSSPCSDISKAEIEFRPLYEKLQDVTMSEIAGMVFLKGISSDSQDWEMSQILRTLNGSMDLPSVVAECRKSLRDKLDFSSTKTPDTLCFTRGGKGSGCLNCGAPDHWVQTCKKPLSDTAKKMLLQGVHGGKDRDREKDRSGGKGQPGKATDKKGKGKDKKGKGKDRKVLNIDKDITQPL